jgi:hypothetical protein
VVFVPRFSYLASAWAHVACYSTMIVGSYLLSRKHYPIDYEKGKIILYILLALLMVLVVNRINYGSLAQEIGFNSLFILAFILLAEYLDKSISIFLKRASGE